MAELFAALVGFVGICLLLLCGAGCGVFFLGMIWVAVTDDATVRARQERAKTPEAIAERCRQIDADRAREKRDQEMLGYR